MKNVKMFKPNNRIYKVGDRVTVLPWYMIKAICKRIGNEKDFRYKNKYGYTQSFVEEMKIYCNKKMKIKYIDKKTNAVYFTDKNCYCFLTEWFKESYDNLNYNTLKILYELEDDSF